MSRYAIDATGQTFGLLTVIGRHGMLGRRAAFLCRCACGNETVTAGTYLRSGYVKSCGCLPYGPARTRIDLTGKRFGRWTVLRAGALRGSATDRTLMWLCRCDCGIEREVNGNNLRRGASTSCHRTCPARSAERAA